MSGNSVFVSREGLVKLEEEIHYLKTVKSKEVADRIEKAKDMGDLSENADYTDAKDEYAWMQGRIREIQDILTRAVVIEAKESDSVGIGCRVRVEVGGKTRDFQVVGSTEADPVQQKVSNESPIGRALIGRKVGDEVPVTAPSGVITYRIVEINC